MSVSFISSLDVASSQTYVYMGIPLIIFGVFGGLLNTIVFLSLRIYRQNSSAFYLTVVSIVDTGQLLTGLLTRVLFNMDTLEWIESSPIFCKLRFSVFELFAIISPTCLCLVAIDQFLSTSTRPQWQQWSNIKIAHRLSAICIIFWLLYGIPYAIYYTPSVSTTTGLTSCVIGNIVYFQYYNIVHIPLFMCGIPLSLTILFGFLASRNIRRHSHQTVPIVRRRHEVQLTMMVLVQVIFNALTTTPSVIVHIISSQSTLTNDPNIAAQLQFAFALTTCLYYVYYAVPFYIYMCVSERFRKQFRYVMIDIYLNRWRRRRRNQVIPHIQVAPKNENQQLSVENIELVSQI